MAGQYSEEDIVQFSRCPLRLGTEQSPSARMKAAEKAWKWVLAEQMKGHMPNAGDIRKVLELSQKSVKNTDGIPRLARRLSELNETFKLLHPVMPYRMSFGRNQVRGEYSVLVSGTERCPEPLIVRLREKDLTRQGPDLINLIRWLHFRNWEPDLPFVRVLNWRIDNEGSWKEFYDEVPVRRQLENLSHNLVEKRVFPVAGEHCSSCQTKTCREVGGSFNG